MEFFDRKEEVLDIQLTPLGKRLVQNGIFKPVFYAFYDHDIIYDGTYAGSPDGQNDIEPRIQTTPRIKQQTILYSVDENINKNTANTYGLDLVDDTANPIVASQKLMEMPGIETIEKKQLELEKFGPLGNMSKDTVYAPSWNIEFLSAPLTGSVTIITGSNNQRIPRLQCDVQYKLEILQLDNISELLETFGANIDPTAAISELSEVLVEHDYALTEHGMGNFNSPLTMDGTYLGVRPDQFFVKVEEDNTEIFKDNFDIEIFKIHGNGEEERLFFNNLMLPEDAEDDPTMVDYYFDIATDADISSFDFCQATKAGKLQPTSADRALFDCSPFEGDDSTVDIYDIPDNEDVELCD